MPDPTTTPALTDLDELEPLPALDGDDDEPLPVPDDDLDAAPADGAAHALEDGTGEDKVDDEDFGDDEASAVGDDLDGVVGEAPEVDALDADAAPIAEGDDAPGILADEVGIDADQGAIVAGDAGEEGLLEDGEELRAEDLPPLDADEDGELSDEGFFEGVGATSDAGWHAEPWDLAFFVPIAEPVTALVPVEGGALAAAGGLFFISELGAVRPLAAAAIDGDIIAFSRMGALVDAVMADGRVFRSSDEGASFSLRDERRTVEVDTSFRLPSGDFVRADLEVITGRSSLRIGTALVADLSRDSDNDGEAARVVALCVASAAVWVALRCGVAFYRTR